MTGYAGRHRAPKSTSTLTRVGATTATSVAAIAVAVPLAATATAAPSTAGVSATSTAKLPTLWLGTRGHLVEQVQRKVGVHVDGVFGKQTKWAVKRWQKRHGLVADGVVGPRTAAKMGIKRTRTWNPKRASRTTSRSSSSIVSTAARYIGTPYVYGGTTPSGFDCSGFTGYVYKKNGQNLPRTAEQQRQATWGTSNPKPGDLVFFGAPAYHVGIYAGGNQIIDAGSSGGRVSKRAIWTRVSYGRA